MFSAVQVESLKSGEKRVADPYGGFCPRHDGVPRNSSGTRHTGTDSNFVASDETGNARSVRCVVTTFGLTRWYSGEGRTSKFSNTPGTTLSGTHAFMSFFHPFDRIRILSDQPLGCCRFLT